jgi:CMD domain protein
MHAHQPPPDVIDNVLRLEPSSPVAQLREKRAELKRLTQSSYVAALRPKDPRNFSYAKRAALACRMARLWKSAELADHYAALLEKEGSDAVLEAVADPRSTPGGGGARLKAILRHVDMVTLSPKKATRADIDALYAAGLDDRDIVTLAGLIAFVNYQVLVVAGLRMLRDH